KSLPKVGTVPTRASKQLSPHRGRANTNSGRQLRGSTTFTETGTCFVPVHRSKNSRRGSARVSRVDFGVDSERAFRFTARGLEDMHEESSCPRARVRQHTRRAGYPSGASSGAATTRVGTSRNPDAPVSSVAAGPASLYSASLFTCQRS